MTGSDAILTIMYGLIALSGVLSISLFVYGLTTYIARLGTVRREEGIKIMEYAIGLMITSIVLVGFLHLMERWFGPF